MTYPSAWELVRGIEPMSLCDWPGRLTAVLFFGGCNLRCPHCHNAALAWTPQAGAAPLTEKAVRRFVTSRRRWLDGLVITGGETDVCVLASALGGIDRGFRVVLVGDALCSFVDETHDALMELYLTRFTEQLEVTTVDEVLESWR